MKKERMDRLLVEKGLASDSEEAARLIMAGLALANDRRVDKAGELVEKDAVLRLKERIPYVSRGGFKLQKAIDEFHIDLKGKTVLDIGSSTGGFTDAALKNGAAKVFALDVGKAQLHYSLRTDPRVVVLERTNFRTADFNVIGRKVDFITADVSFISLELIIPQCVLFCREGTGFVALIKPQFEAEREEVGRGGVVTDEKAREKTREKIIRKAAESCFLLRGAVVSPITGAKGNVEYLAYFVYKDSSGTDNNGT